VKKYSLSPGFWGVVRRKHLPALNQLSRRKWAGACGVETVASERSGMLEPNGGSDCQLRKHLDHRVNLACEPSGRTSNRTSESAASFVEMEPL
jgi:hypothetical protein